MSRSRPIAVALTVGVLCTLGVLAAPALLASAAGTHARGGHSSARRGAACRRHPHRHRRCRTASHAAKHHHGGHRRAERRAAHQLAGVGGTSNSPGAGIATPTASPGPDAAPGAGGVSSSGEPASGTTETPAAEAPPAEVPGAPATPRVQVIAKEYSFTLSRAEVPAGKVIVEFVNGGEDPHNLHLEEPAESVEAGSFPTSSPGFHGDLTLNLRPGSYTLFCSLPGHEAKGMKATLTVH
jgi:plastocyanin